MFKAHIVAEVGRKDMKPVINKIYKTHTGAQNAMIGYKIKNPDVKNIKVLCADNWRE